VVKKVLERIPSILRNKYILVLIAAGVWFLFFDKNSLIEHYKISRQIRELKQERDYYLEQIEADSIELDRLKNNPAEMERYAREKYLMKKKDEDIFIVKE
jgi:cell division protein DivIC